MKLFKRKSKVWTTKDGTQIPIRELTDEHLLNIYAYLLKRTDLSLNCAIHAGYQAQAMLNGEMACWCIEQDIQAMEEDRDGYYLEHFYAASHPLALDIEKEVNRRALQLHKKPADLLRELK